MSDVLLRVLKRYTSLEVPFDEFFQTEMLDTDGRPDLFLSVFDVDRASLVRTHAEFVVSVRQIPEPKRRRGGLCALGCAGDSDLTPCPAAGLLFAYARGQHAELRFMDEAELRRTAARLHAEHVARERSASFGDVIAYGQGRLGAADPEWIDAREQRPKWGKALGR